MTLTVAVQSVDCKRLYVQTTLARALDLHRACRVYMTLRRFALLFSVLVGLGLPASNADASPFVITLLGSGSSGGHSDDGTASVDGRAASTDDAASDADRLGLSVRGSRTTATWPTLGFPGGALSLIPAIKRALAAANVFGPTAFLDLGDGEYLAVSSDVAESLVRGVPADSSPADGHNGSGQVPSVVPSQGPTQTVLNDVTVRVGSNGAWGNDMIGGVLADVSSGLVHSPAEAGFSLAEAAARGLAPAAETPAHTPEPATLILLASALAITARRLRRPRT
jgi:hypothetical protein